MQESALKKYRNYLFENTLKDNLEKLKKYIATQANQCLNIQSPITPLGMNVLHVAVTAKRESIVRWLVEEVNLDVNIADNNKRTPLHYAAAHGFLQLSEYLIKNGANVNSQTNGGDTPLMKASYFCHFRVIYLLLCQAETDVTLVNSQNETYLQILQLNDVELQQRFMAHIKKQCPRLPLLQEQQEIQANQLNQQMDIEQESEGIGQNFEQQQSQQQKLLKQ